VLAEARGDLDDAAARYQDAADRWGGFGVALEQGLALLGASRCATRLSRPAGRDRLLEANELLARLGARGLLAEAGAVPGV
jgi:hypothetical protein